MKKSTKFILISVAIIIVFIAFNIVADFINWNSGKCKMCGTQLKLVNVTNNEIRLYHYVCPKCGNTIEITYHGGFNYEDNNQVSGYNFANNRILSFVTCRQDNK